MSKVCVGCWRYLQFKKNCMFFWDDKKECSRWVETATSPETHKKVETDVGTLFF